MYIQLLVACVAAAAAILMMMMLLLLCLMQWKRAHKATEMKLNKSCRVIGLAITITRCNALHSASTASWRLWQESSDASVVFRGHPRSVIFYLIWKSVCDFLLVISCSNLGPLSHRLTTIARTDRQGYRSLMISISFKCHFLLVINGKHGPISHRFRDRLLIAWNIQLKIAAKLLQMET